MILVRAFHLRTSCQAPQYNEAPKFTPQDTTEYFTDPWEEWDKSMDEVLHELALRLRQFGGRDSGYEVMEVPDDLPKKYVQLSVDVVEHNGSGS